MSIAWVCLQQRHRMIAAGYFLCVAGLVAWTTAIALGKAPTAPASAVQAAPVHISIRALDLSRLVPAQFGDWDVAAADRPAR